MEAWAEFHQEELLADWLRIGTGTTADRTIGLIGMRMDMSHLICRVTSFENCGPYLLRVRFDDDTEQTIDFLPVLAGELLGPLRDKALFDQVRVDPEVHTLVWPNGADFDPATLHDWPKYASELASRAKQRHLSPI